MNIPPSPTPATYPPPVGRSIAHAVAWAVVILLVGWLTRSVWVVAGAGCLAVVSAWATGRMHARSQTEAIDGFAALCHGEIRQSQERWRLLHRETRQNASALLQLTDGVVVLSPDEAVLLINPSAVRLLDLQRREPLLGRSFTEIVRQPELTASIRNAVAEQHPQEFTLEFQHQAGVRPIRVRVDLIDTGESQNLQLSLRDETEPRRVEEMRREFIANVSHELKTPLAAIKGYAETTELAIQDDPEMAVHFLSQITAQCYRLERLVNEMMQLARAQSGRDFLHVSSVSLAEIVAESVRAYDPVARAGGIELIAGTDGQKAKVMADREATLTIANNLIGNAVRYTPSGGQVRVFLRPDRETWSLVVEDTGVGIAAEDQKRIFERFYRGSRNAESSSSSTGLGLAIVKNLAQAQQGEVHVRSEPGEGSTFWVCLPAVAAGGEPIKTSPSSVSATSLS